MSRQCRSRVVECSGGAFEMVEIACRGHGQWCWQDAGETLRSSIMCRTPLLVPLNLWLLLHADHVAVIRTSKVTISGRF